LGEISKERVLIAQEGLRRLTGREKQVMQLIVTAHTSKEAAEILKVSPRTIEIYRRRTFEKLGARNAADLVRIVAVLP
jgi:DNA-binding CsgD family transcriptional regulator